MTFFLHFPIDTFQVELKNFRNNGYQQALKKKRASPVTRAELSFTRSVKKSARIESVQSRSIARKASIGRGSLHTVQQWRVFKRKANPSTRKMIYREYSSPTDLKSY